MRRPISSEQRYQNMKRRLLAVVLACGAACSSLAQPVVYTFNFTNAFNNAGVVPDGSTLGWSDTRLISGIPGTNHGTAAILDVNVFLQISSGYNGDLYGYLAHPGGFAVLLNRVGLTNGTPFGYGDAGMNLKFDDSASNGDIHYYQLVFGYNINNGSSWAPDGRNIDPLLVNGTEPRGSLLDSFNGLNANGSWTLFLSDLSVGGQSTVMQWGMEVTAAPEPASWAIAGLALLIGGARFVRTRRHQS